MFKKKSHSQITGFRIGALWAASSPLKQENESSFLFPGNYGHIFRNIHGLFHVESSIWTFRAGLNSAVLERVGHLRLLTLKIFAN